MENNNIKLIRNCEWEEVFLFWCENENKNPGMIELARSRGFPSWADWRISGYAKPFQCARARWGLYEVSNPAKVILDWYGGPFRSFIERYYDNQPAKTFQQIINESNIAENDKVQSMISSYPEFAVISALKLKDDRVFVIEGMHRTCALALMQKGNLPAPDKLTFVIGASDLAELPAVGKNTYNK